MLTLRQRSNESGSSNATKLSKKDILQNTLEEARTVLPGVQAIFGFQLIAVFNKPFYDLSYSDQVIHLAALCLSVLSGCLLMAPAAYHRIAEKDAVSEDLLNYSGRTLCAAMLPLALSISMDIYVIAKLVTQETLVSVLLGLFTLLIANYFWFFIPLRAQRRKAKQPQV